MKKTIFKRTIISMFTLLVIALGSTVIKIWPENYFWIERNNARMPVWVRGNIDSGIFIVFNHGGPAGCGTAESLFEVNPIYGAKDLRAPVDVGQGIFQGISTPESQKTLLILPNSRHGAEGNDVLLMQTAIKDFINQTLMVEK
jgi:hypothetical protein